MEVKAYKYGMRLRPYGMGCQQNSVPKGTGCLVGSFGGNHSGGGVILPYMARRSIHARFIRAKASRLEVYHLHVPKLRRHNCG